MSMDKQVKLISLDDEIIQVDLLVAHESQTLKDMIEAEGNENPISLPNISSKILEKVMDYCRYHAESKKTSDDQPAVSPAEVEKWNKEFLKVDVPTLLGLVMATEYLNVQNLLKLASQTVADIIANCKSAEEIRKTFNIVDDLTEEQEGGVQAGE